jgi:hypothetical protein
MANVCKVTEKVNAARVAAGLNPLDTLPRGARHSRNSCPLARAFRDLGPVSVGGGGIISGVPTDKAFLFASAMGGTVESHNGTATVLAPEDLANFVRDFDNGYHPEFSESAF